MKITKGSALYDLTRIGKGESPTHAIPFLLLCTINWFMLVIFIIAAIIFLLVWFFAPAFVFYSFYGLLNSITMKFGTHADTDWHGVIIFLSMGFSFSVGVTVGSFKLIEKSAAALTLFEKVITPISVFSKKVLGHIKIGPMIEVIEPDQKG